jgi:dTDP-4-dehydrorhamnose reductase
LILELAPDKSGQRVKQIIPVLTPDFPTTAQRPLFSALDCAHFLATFGLKLPDWESALQLALE